MLPGMRVRYNEQHDKRLKRSPQHCHLNEPTNQHTSQQKYEWYEVDEKNTEKKVVTKPKRKKQKNNKNR